MDNPNSIVNRIKSVAGNSGIGDDLKKITTDVKNALNSKMNNSYLNNGSYTGKHSIFSNIEIADESINFFKDFNSPVSSEIIRREREYAILLKSMPILETAINLLRDNVLSVDSILQDFIIAKRNNTDRDDVTFSDNIKYLKEKYDILSKIDEMFLNVCKYGEEFYHIIKYDDGIKKLKKEISLNEMKGIEADRSFSIKFDKTNIVFSEGLSYREFNNIVTEDTIVKLNKQKSNQKQSKKGKKEDNKAKGSIIRVLKRENIIPLYINDTCLGYYYIEIYKKQSDNPYGTGGSNFNKDMNEKYKKEISNLIAKQLNDKFIQSNNYYANDIYNILKYVSDLEKSEINVMYIKPEECIHWYFNRDCNNRGISDLDRAFVPAKTWLLLTNSYNYNIVFKGHDTRVIYYKPTAGDPEMRSALQKTIKQIVSTGRSGFSAFPDMASIANFTGRHEILVAPVNNSGEPALQFDTIQGQDINIDNEYLDNLEKQAVEALNMPYDYVKSSNETDFATKIVQSNNKFVTYCLKRQSMLNKNLTKLFRVLYSNEFESEIIDLDISLVQPVTLRNNSNLSVIESSISVIEKLADYNANIDTNDPNAETKRRLWIKNYLTEKYAGYIEPEIIDTVNKNTEIEYAKFMSTLNQDGE